ncbi:MAG: hypothetical protein IV100_07880 [Myxococcales bacterium]|nr:hypothetical protein [Myxococcales bacterium]
MFEGEVEFCEPLQVVADYDQAVRSERQQECVDALTNELRSVRELTIQQIEIALDFVELTLFTGVVYEGLVREGATWLEAMRSQSIQHHVQAFSGIDFPTARRAIANLVANKHLPEPKPPKRTPVRPELLPHVVRCVRESLSASAEYVESVVEGARALDRPDLAFRLARAFVKMQAFLVRHEAAPETLALSTLYAKGSVSAQEFADVLKLSVPDGIALLEELGACRPIGVMRLSTEERRSKAERLRGSRSTVRENPELDAAHAARSVIASQRIEDVDARPWVHP